MGRRNGISSLRFFSELISLILKPGENLRYITTNINKLKIKVRQPHYFTIIELLVVVAIISILMSILLPALKTARDTTMRISCLNNIKQVGQLFLFYADDNQGYLPHNKAYNPTVYNYYWEDNLADTYLKKGSRTADHRIFRCPSCSYFDNIPVRTNYGSNRPLVTDWSTYIINPPARIHLLKHSSMTMLSADNGGHGDVLYDSSTAGFNIHFRHGGRTSIYFADAHAESKLPRQIPTYHCYKALGGAVNLNTKFWTGEIVGSYTNKDYLDY